MAREVTALERDDPRAALALYKVVASVNTAIANRCKMALGRMADAAFDNRGPRVDSELRFLLVVLTYLLLDARNAQRCHSSNAAGSALES